MRYEPEKMSVFVTQFRGTRQRWGMGWGWRDRRAVGRTVRVGEIPVL